MRKPLRCWRTASETSTWRPRITTKTEDPGCHRIAARILPQSSNRWPTAPTLHHPRTT
jgi:hypothetical protein